MSIVVAVDVLEDFSASIGGLLEAASLEHLVFEVPMKD